jgi:hypothetical protein
MACVASAGIAPARADGIDGPRVKAVASCDAIRLVCENARTYGLCPIAVTDGGELVTARLSPGYHHVRLIPMGNGYRYAGRNIWFDGKYNAGRLYFGLHRSVACTVE